MAVKKYTYLGPASTIQESADAKPVKPGEAISLSDEQVRALVADGHQFEGVASPSLPLTSDLASQPAAEESSARGRK